MITTLKMFANLQGSNGDAPDYLKVVSANRELKNMKEMLMGR
jgi:hypothetical protein